MNKDMLLMNSFFHRLLLKGEMGMGLLLSCLLFIMNSCIEEGYTSMKKLEGADITLVLNLPVISTISRAIEEDDHENKIATIYVLLFDQSGMYVDKYEGTDIEDLSPTDSSKKKFKVKLPFGDYDLMVLANVKDIVDGASLDDTMNKENVIKALTFSETDTHKWGDPATFVPFPMWGELKNIKLESSTTSLGKTIYMIRSVVRIDVILPYGITFPQSTQFGTLQSVYLYNYYTKGQIIPDDGTCTIINPDVDPEFTISQPSIPSGAGKTVGPIFYKYDNSRSNHNLNNPNAGDTLAATIYTFEAIAGSKNTLENTCLVLGIGGKEDEGGTGANAPPRTRAGVADSTYYYRVDFVNGDQDDPNVIHWPLLRNHNYVVTVKSIVNRGFPEPGQAYRSQPYDMTYTVAEWEADYNTNAKYDGIHRLDISSTFLEMDNSYEIITISTTHPEGWSAFLSAYPDRIETPANYWLKILGVADDMNWWIPPIEDLPAERTMYMEIQAGFPGVGGGQYDEGYIHIISGNLRNVITVRRWGWDEA